MMLAKAREPAAANLRNHSSPPNKANSNSATEKSRLATFFNIKSDQAAFPGVFHLFADVIFWALCTNRNDTALPSTAAAPRAGAVQA